MKFKRRCLLLLSTALLIFPGCNLLLPVGQRLLDFEILIDDQIQLSGFRGVNDNMPIHQMWDVLPDITFEHVDKKTKIDAPNQTTLTYQGKIGIRIKHVDEELDSISTTTLTLSRSETTNAWSLSQKDIDRLKHLLNQR
jgi:hypothetical protein